MNEEKKELTEEERKELKEKLKKQVDEMSDEELDKVLGRLVVLFHMIKNLGEYGELEK